MENDKNKWEYNLIYSLEITTKTGLHIGGSNEDLKIGGTDNPVITTRYNIKEGKYLDLPYIPGSSIKGRMRSLLLSVYDENDINILFGASASNKDETDRRPRMIIRDAYLDKPETYEEDSATEIKGENTIDYLTSMANPRMVERVKPETKFTGEIIIMKYKNDDENKLKKTLEEGINFVNDSYLGGNGTRGYGKVLMKLVFKEKRDKSHYEGMADGSIPN